MTQLLLHTAKMILMLMTVVLLVHFRFDGAHAVFYGQVAQPGEFKYLALLKVTRGHDLDVCGGAIISNSHILTGWHCVDGAALENIEVIVGAVRFTDDPNGKAHQVSRISLHPSRSCEPRQLRCYDIAVLTLTELIEFNDHVDEISLPDGDVTPGAKCVFAGWGATDRVPNDTSDDLRFGYGMVWHSLVCNLKLTLKTYEFCFRYVNNSIARPGGGDSGGPFVCGDVVAGIIIRGGIDPNTPTTAINVYRVLRFVCNAMDADNCQVAAEPTETEH